MHLIVEILVEEMPAHSLASLNAHRILTQLLERYEIDAKMEFFYTPRRLVLESRDFPSHTIEKSIELFGPPLALVQDASSKALGAFLSKNNLSLKDVLNEDGAFKSALKNGKETIYLKLTKSAQETQALVPSFVKDFLGSLDFKKSMRFHPSDESFIRPVRNILCLLDSKFIQIECYGLSSGQFTAPFRDASLDSIFIPSASEYFKIVKNSGVILDHRERERQILDQIERLCKSQDIEVEIDSELLREIVAITEHPKALLGEFDKEFLSLPKEVTITSMKENQRYFAVHDSAGALKNAFILVANTTAQNVEKIIRGNENVLRARLSDAMFFYENDLKEPFKTRPLKELTFHKNSSMFDKVEREMEIANYLFESLDIEHSVNKERLLESIRISKCDLLSEMVGEFPSLQGIMGARYALAKGLSPHIALNLEEQYLPSGDTSPLPSTLESSLVALSHKLDNLIFFFSHNEIPTGSKDPYALRRSASGALKIILKNNINFDLKRDFESIAKMLDSKIDLEKLVVFSLERLEGILELNPSLIRAITEHELRINHIEKKARALNEALQAQPLFYSIFKRVANILKNETPSALKKELLKEKQEIALSEQFQSIPEGLDYAQELARLFDLKDALDDFFNNVRIMDDNLELRRNRIALVGLIHARFLNIADIKLISL